MTDLIRVGLRTASLFTIAMAGWLAGVIVSVLPARDPGHVPLWSVVAAGSFAFVALSLVATRPGRSLDLGTGIVLTTAQRCRGRVRPVRPRVGDDECPQRRPGGLPLRHRAGPHRARRDRCSAGWRRSPSDRDDARRPVSGPRPDRAPRGLRIARPGDAGPGRVRLHRRRLVGRDSLAENEAAWRRRTLRPRVLVDVAACRQATTLLGVPARCPSRSRRWRPTASSTRTESWRPPGRRRPRASRSSSRRCRAGRSRRSAEAIPDATRWFQLYAQAEPRRTRRLVERAAAAGYGRARADRRPAGARLPRARPAQRVPPPGRMATSRTTRPATPSRDGAPTDWPATGT